MKKYLFVIVMVCCMLSIAAIKMKSSNSKAIKGLRSGPVVVSHENAKKVFKLNKFYMVQNQIMNSFVDNGKIVTDNATNLMWQKAGSDKSLNFAMAKEYIAKLNKTKFSGHSDWRLPTVSELTSLVNSTKKISATSKDSIFNKKQAWIWSSDTLDKSSKYAWYVIPIGGRVVNSNDRIASSFVRAVRTKK